MKALLKSVLYKKELCQYKVKVCLHFDYLQFDDFFYKTKKGKTLPTMIQNETHF